MGASDSPAESAKFDRRAAQDARTRQQILNAAGHCFAEQGIRGTTLDDVAAAANVSKPLIYKHFDGKSGLIDAVLDQVHAEWLATNSREIDSASSAAEALAIKFRASIETAEKRPILRAILRQDLTFLSPDKRASFVRARARSRQRTADILQWGINAGEFRGDLDMNVTADVIETILYALVERTLRTSRADTVSEPLVNATLTLLARGLVAAPAQGLSVSQRKGRTGGDGGS